MADIQLTARCSGAYTFHRVKSSGERSEIGSAPCKNVILDATFAAPWVGGAYFGGMMVGTGNSQPHPSQTALDAFVGGSNTKQLPFESRLLETEPPYRFLRSWTVRFSGADIGGQNISEVGNALVTTLGFAKPTADTPCASRALVRDAQGNPTSVTILADEFLDVTYTIVTYPLIQSGSMTLLDRGTPRQIDWSISPHHMLSGVEWGSPRTDSSSPPIAVAVVPSTFSATSLTCWVGYGKEANPLASNQATVSADSSNTFTQRLDSSYAEGTGVTTIRIPLNNANLPNGFDCIGLRFGLPVTSTILTNSLLGTHLITLSEPIVKTSDDVFDLTISITATNYNEEGD